MKCNRRAYYLVFRKLERELYVWNRPVGRMSLRTRSSRKPIQRKPLKNIQLSYAIVGVFI